ncbi:MAG: diguanylate cyclase [Holosporaceae bacterium]|jgi:two-component system cell cycle response regulator|nr:diguanylate cyclase [Holosporaceae bacterium]
MVARVLIINENKKNVLTITSKLKKNYYSLLFSKSIEESLRIVGAQTIDLVLLSLPKNSSEKTSKLFYDFFSVLRQLCCVIPIIAVVESKEQVIPSLRFDDVIFNDIEEFDLIERLRTLMKLKNKFDSTLLRNIHLEEQGSRKITTIFHQNTNFLHPSIYENTEVVQINDWPTLDHNDSNLFIIDANHKQAYECCAHLRLRETTQNKLVVFTYDERSHKKIKTAINLDIGVSDFWNVENDPFFIKFRLNTLLHYQNMHEIFLKKLKKSLYLSAIDSATEVYNRSFFEDYLKNKECCISKSAIAMLDVDKFKSVNDKHGHSFADSMLKHISSVIKKHIRSSDIVARYGGDEFIILMNDVSRSDAIDITSRIQKKIGSSLFHDACCTVSIGLCCVEPHGIISSFRDAIMIADSFMYAAKRDGGNAIRVCE